MKGDIYIRGIKTSVSESGDIIRPGEREGTSEGARRQTIGEEEANSCPRWLQRV